MTTGKKELDICNLNRHKKDFEDEYEFMLLAVMSEGTGQFLKRTNLTKFN
jgi:hypothetical protein